MVQPARQPVCDYEGSDYRARFWEGKGRDYEDRVERIALRRLLPRTGHRLIDVGAGFGRLADEYAGYEQVVLFDYSRTLLREAQELLGHDPRYLYVAGDWYQMPFIPASFDTMVQVRTIHHAADVPALLRELAHIAAPKSHYVLEFANKRNLKAILRYLLQRQAWSPFTPDPVEFAELNFDFHPNWMRQRLEEAGFHPHQHLSVSHFRLGLLKRLAPTDWLVALDRMLQPTGRFLQLTPSVFIASTNQNTNEISATKAGTIFACPACRTPLEPPEHNRLLCTQCGRVWRVDRGLYDFKEPAE